MHFPLTFLKIKSQLTASQKEMTHSKILRIASYSAIKIYRIAAFISAGMP